ncbi:MFS transporter [Collinsella sp. zg1085]|uniref:MFS transporter n=1 Tax=Collinsella sp. zg1085 TaxID=2844380 RepID=UPI001C0D3EDE|nr:MFS transporter [Collinsella sp. zg1085]QWT17279.1 MFS transporter [Collinsella sp. zg1085]
MTKHEQTDNKQDVDEQLVTAHAITGEPASASPSWQRMFYIISAGQAISLIGSSAVQFALMWQLTIDTGSPAMMGLAGLAGYVPQALLSPVAGIVADRLNRKLVCIASDLSVGILALALALIMMGIGTPAWAILLTLALRSALGAFQPPAMQAMIPQIVPKAELIRAGGITQMVNHAAYLVGPALGAVLYAAMPLNMLLITDLVGAVAASVCLWPVPVPSLEQLPVRSEGHALIRMLSEMREGVAVYTGDASLGILIISIFSFDLFFMPLMPMFPLVTASFFKLGSFEASIEEVVSSLGMLLAGGAMAQLKLSHEFRFALSSLGVCGVATFALGIVPPNYVGWLLYVAISFVLCVFYQGFNVPMTAYMQRVIPSEKLGRAFALRQMLSVVTMPLGLVIASPVAEGVGIMNWFVIAGVAVILNALLSFFAYRRFVQAQA